MEEVVKIRRIIIDWNRIGLYNLPGIIIDCNWLGLSTTLFGRALCGVSAELRAEL